MPSSLMKNYNGMFFESNEWIQKVLYKHLLQVLVTKGRPMSAGIVITYVENELH